jgi:hypothetical protein
MTKKIFVDANSLLCDSLRLARIIFESGYRPNFLVGLWRGGTPPGIAIHEYFRIRGLDPYHTAIKTQSYRDIGVRGAVEIKGLDHVISAINSEDNLLIVDDVFDTGHTIREVEEYIRTNARKNTPDIKVAVVYYKPEKNETDIVPDFYLKVTSDWIVFPHELEHLTPEEIRAKSKEIYDILYE